MQKNKKGFTLIELLAVLVILAILALITIPIVLSIIRNAKENSYARSVESYGRAVENAVMEYQMNNEDTEELPKSFNAYTIKTTKNEVTCDSIDFDENDSVVLKGCRVGTKSHKYNYKNGKAYISEENTSTTNTAYSVGDSITVAGEQYYVITDSGSNQDYVTALKANPLTATEINTYGGTLRYTYEDTNATGGMSYGTSSEYSSSHMKDVVNSWAASKFNNDELRTVDGYDARLITYDELNAMGEVTRICTGGCYYEFILSYDWLYSSNYTYCTMTPYQYGDSSPSLYEVWSVNNEGRLSGNNVGDGSNLNGAVRPVINVYKNKINS